MIAELNLGNNREKALYLASSLRGTSENKSELNQTLSIYLSMSHSLEAVGRHADGAWNTGSPKLSVFSFSDELLKIEASPVFDVI